METQTNIVQLLAGSLSASGAASLIQTGSNNSRQFDQLLKREIDAPVFVPKPPAPAGVKGSPKPQTASETKTPPPDNTPVKKERRPAQPAETEPKTTDPSDPASAQPATATVAENPGNSVTPVKPETAEPVSPAGSTLPNGTSEEILARQLEALNLDSETINRILNALKNPSASGTSANQLLRALPGLLQATGAVDSVPGLNDPAGMPTSLSTSNRPPEQLALDVLIQAGFSEEEARAVLDRARQAAALPVSPQEGQSQGKLRAATVLQVAGAPDAPQAVSRNLQNQSGLNDPNQEPSNLQAVLREISERAGDNLEKVGAKSPPQNANPAASQTSASNIAPRPGFIPLLHLAAQEPVAVNPQPPAPATPGQPATGPQGVGEMVTKSVETAKPQIPEMYTARGTAERTVTNQIIEKFTIRGLNLQREIHIKLDPPTLGTVRMNVASNGEGVRTTIVAETHFVKQVIENNLTQLRESMTSQGLKVDSFTVLVGGDQNQNIAHHRREQIHSYGDGNSRVAHLDTGGEELTFSREPVFFREHQTFSLFA